MFQDKAEEGGNAVALSTDGAMCQWHMSSTDRNGVQTNAVLEQKAGAYYSIINATVHWPLTAL